MPAKNTTGKCCKAEMLRVGSQFCMAQGLWGALLELGELLLSFPWMQGCSLGLGMCRLLNKQGEMPQGGSARLLSPHSCN